MVCLNNYFMFVFASGVLEIRLRFFFYLLFIRVANFSHDELRH